MTLAALIRNARRALKDIGEATAWKMSVSEVKSAARYYLRAVDRGYETRLSKDELETLKKVCEL